MQFNKHIPVLMKCPLFTGIEPGKLNMLLPCLSANIKEYTKSSLVAKAGEKPEDVGIILSGNIHILREDYWGGRQIISSLAPGDLFGESFLYAGVRVLPVSVRANEDSEVLFINGDRLIRSCPNSCDFHAGLISNMMKLIAGKNVALTRKIGHITRRGLREKVLSYLSEQAVLRGENSFEIPFNRQELADYLSVDRSALSGELSRMQEEGLISYRKNGFTMYK
jgi:CRP-like cAMP-binding protein